LERVARFVVGCGLAVTVLAPTAALAQVPNLGSAESFAVLAGATVTNTGVTSATGDVGVAPNGTITGAAIAVVGGSIHEGDAVAAQAHLDASETYAELEAMTCGTNLTGQNLGGMNLSSGVYCFDADAALSGAPLDLTGAGPWIIQVAGALSATAGVTIAASTATCNGSNVFWQIGTTASVGAGTSFVGNILAQTGVTLGAGAVLDGRAVAIDTASTVTLDTNAVSACSFGEVVPVHDPIKVTGGGQIDVDGGNPAFANYGFNATPTAEGATGHLNYRNHATGLHVNGTVTDADVVTMNDDGSPKMVRFSGTCANGPTCTFSVTVEDNGEPAIDDRFGIVVVGSEADETTADRVVRNGNIQFHLSLTTNVGATNFRTGDVMDLTVSLTPGTAPPPRADAYLVLQLPNGQLLSWTGNGLAPGLVPLARNIKPVNYRAVMARLAIPADAPAGTYSWFSGLAEPGTLNLVSEIAERRFTISR
jgi:type VI secretion system secreted protein VgrG